MRPGVLLVLLAVLAGAAPAAQAARRPARTHARAVSPLGHAGRWLTDGHGRVVIVHGVNMVNKLAPFYPAALGFGNDDAAFLARVGLDAVRVGVLWQGVEPAPGVYDNAYLARIAQTVRILARHGIYSLLDFHQDLYNQRFQGEGEPAWAVQDDGLPAVPQLGFPGNYEGMPALQAAFDNFWNDSPGPGGVGLQERYAAAWRHVAARFARVPGVLGYDIFNEPFPGTTYLTCASSAGCPADDAKLSAFDRRVDQAIRAADRRTLVFDEPNVLFDFGFPTDVTGPGDRRAGFSFHDYCLTNEAQGCSSHATVFANAAAHVRATGQAEMLTEFGATNSTTDLDSMVALADQNMVPWVEWAYCGCGDPTTAGPGTVQAIVIDPAKPPTGSNVEWSTLRALVEPYPQVVAGTPLAWGFDRASRRFRLRYSTRRAGGRGRFRAGTITTIVTPRLVYRGRYGARVAGGRIVSRRGAAVLAIASCPRARTVTVTVAPRLRDRSGCVSRRPRSAA